MYEIAAMNMDWLVRERIRKRLWYVFAMLGVMALGLVSRRIPGLFPTAFGKYPGDVLWTLMVFLGWAIVFPKSPTVKIMLLALVTSFAVEFAKFHHAPWLENFRNTTFGHLVLGYTFSWGNLVAYTIGAAVGACGEWLLSVGRRQISVSE
ncbi:MAG: DUF2809 domain-containing protein [Luteolibacter sp.]